ncbi:MAG: glycosyltransferase family 4 protein, partial [Planctomycetes bacterium]|nr:glycosyltransferase family 4 protein [Planctomycetota bacterium]
YLTAGAAGMFCGSCMHDNTLAAALSRLGVDIQLIPTYTPIRTDEHDVSVDHVFFGGVNVYLQQKYAFFRHLPPLLDRLFDQPRFLRWVTSRGLDVDADVLGALTVSMLRGVHGYQRKEVRRLCRWLASSVRPDLVVLTNMLIGGCIPEIQRTLKVPVLVTLQGDDVFLDHYLRAPYRQQALDEIRRLVASVDGFLVHSRFYGDFMTEYFGLNAERVHRVPLGIDTLDFQPIRDDATRRQVTAPRRIGYLARLTPEKGLHVLVDAFIELRQRPGCEDVELHVAGWLGDDERPYAEAEFAKLRDAGLHDALRFAGSVDRAGKIEFLSKLDVFTVPTTYRDPKGLFVLEALAAGVAVVQPNHGAFPELLEITGGGCLAEPGDPRSLADQLHRLLNEPETRAALATAGQAAVHGRCNAQRMAEGTLEVFRRFV